MQHFPKLHYDWVSPCHQQPSLTPEPTLFTCSHAHQEQHNAVRLCLRILLGIGRRVLEPGSKQDRAWGPLHGLGLTPVVPQGSVISVLIRVCLSISCGWALASPKSLAQSTAAFHKAQLPWISHEMVTACIESWSYVESSHWHLKRTVKLPSASGTKPLDHMGPLVLQLYQLIIEATLLE